MKRESLLQLTSTTQTCLPCVGLAVSAPWPPGHHGIAELLHQGLALQLPRDSSAQPEKFCAVVSNAIPQHAWDLLPTCFQDCLGLGQAYLCCAICLLAVLQYTRAEELAAQLCAYWSSLPQQASQQRLSSQQCHAPRTNKRFKTQFLFDIDAWQRRLVPAGGTKSSRSKADVRSRSSCGGRKPTACLSSTSSPQDVRTRCTQYMPFTV